MRKMRKAADGWKRCSRCFAAVMGLELRIRTLGQAPEFSAEPVAVSGSPLRLPVKWRSDVSRNDQ